MAGITYDEAAHLMRRMAFGGSPEEIDNLVSMGREGAVDHLLDYQNIDNKSLDDLLASSFSLSDPRDNTKFNEGEIRRWWFTRIVHSRRQFEEKMTLFWHNHFATALSKVQDPLMFLQNLTLRTYALDRFDVLLLNVAQDPAMLIWLDGITNVSGNPNENWARELQELFTMGINDVVTGEPNYSENDVKEVARAFTGWKFRGPSRTDPNQLNYQFFVNAIEHDNTSKTVYSQTANYTGDDIITIVSARKATGRFLVKKLFDFFVYPLSSSAADKATIENFADAYLNKNHSIKELVRAIFISEEFFSLRARFALVKSPVELVVSAIRMLGGQYNSGSINGGDRRQTSNVLAANTRQMGQDLFNPPDVAGWDLNLGWVNTANMLNRFNYANTLTTNRRTDQPGAFVTNDQLAKYTKASTKKTVKKLLSVLGPLVVESTTIRNLRDYLETDDNGQQTAFVVNDATIDKKIRGLIHQIMSLPEFEQN